MYTQLSPNVVVVNILCGVCVWHLLYIYTLAVLCEHKNIYIISVAWPLH